MPKTMSTSLTEIHRKVNAVSEQQTPKALSMDVNEKSKRSKELEPSRSMSLPLGKASLDRKSSIENSFPNVDDFSWTQMHDSLKRLRENTLQPFTYLCNILPYNKSDDKVSKERSSRNEIDLKLASLTRRIQLNKSLLERTNERTKKINFLVERNAIIASRELNYDNDETEFKAAGEGPNDSDTALNIACPGIMELKRTMTLTKDMLGYVKKICNNEMAMKDLPNEMSHRMIMENNKS